jgi:prepilin-type N-terminal cleavage/methylation domain-containing protein
MLARIRKSQEENEGGFTLIELLVVIIIIGILAAIAIPTFLNQRKKGWDAAAKSALKNAATAQESFYTEASAYTSNLSSLAAEGFKNDTNVPLSFGTVSSSTYIMTAKHANSENTYCISTATGKPAVTTTGSC